MTKRFLHFMSLTAVLAATSSCGHLGARHADAGVCGEIASETGKAKAFISAYQAGGGQQTQEVAARRGDYFPYASLQTSALAAQAHLHYLRRVSAVMHCTGHAPGNEYAFLRVTYASAPEGKGGELMF
jgi:hypothetical protein